MLDETRRHVVHAWTIGVLALATSSSLFLGIAASVKAQSVESSSDSTSDSPFPKDWYVRDGEGLEELRSLEGKPAKELSVSEWRGDSTTLEQLKGKIVVLDFWATWCGPCMAVIPKNVKFIDEYQEKGVALIGIHDAKSGWDNVDKVISDKGINYPVALDSSKESQGETAKAYALKFWPTYVIIDRDGIVRAAGIKPNKIEEAVDQLLGGKPGTSTGQASVKIAAFPEKWFLGGSKRSKSAVAVEGKPAPKLAVSQWLGNSIEADNWEQRVRVVQFVRPELAASVDQLSKLQTVAERFASQGVVFLAVCDARAGMDRMKSIAEEKRIEIPIAMDRASESDPPGPGTTSNSMGIKFAPATIVIDRTGILRASGLKTDFLDNVLNQLLAEAIPIQEPVNDRDIDEIVERPKVDGADPKAEGKGEAAKTETDGDKPIKPDKP